MGTRVPEIYLVELYNQCKFAAQAHTAAYSALDRFGKGPADTIGPGRRYQREVFRNLHSLLGHAANVAALLWPPEILDETARERGRELRRRLEVPDGEHVLRGAAKHVGGESFGEELDSWLAERDPDRVYLDHITAPSETLGAVSADRRMRTFDPSTGTLQLWGRRVPVDELTHAIKEVALRTEQLLRDMDGVRLRHEPGSRRGP